MTSLVNDTSNNLNLDKKWHSGKGKLKMMDRGLRNSGFNRFRDIGSGFTEFCRSTSIHGLRYLGDRDKRMMSCFVWLIIVVMSFVGAGYIIYGSVQGRRQSFSNVQFSQLFQILS